jgi:hypothetical protein
MSSHIEDDIMKNCEQKQKLKKRENPRFYGRNKLLFWNPTLQPLGSFSHMAPYRNSKKKTKKNSPCMELELNVLGIARKLVKHVVHLLERKK